MYMVATLHFLICISKDKKSGRKIIYGDIKTIQLYIKRKSFKRNSIHFYNKLLDGKIWYSWSYYTHSFIFFYLFYFYITFYVFLLLFLYSAEIIFIRSRSKYWKDGTDFMYFLIKFKKTKMRVILRYNSFYFTNLK